MAVFDNTALNATIDEKWDKDVQEGRYAMSVVLPRVYNRSDLVATSGDKVNMTYENTYTVGDVTAATGAFTAQQLTYTSVQIEMDQWKQVSIEVVDKAKFQSYYSPDSDFPAKASKAIAAGIDSALLALYGNFTDNTPWGTADNPSAFDENAASYALLELADNDVPKDELSFILPPTAYYKGILRKPEFADASKLGLPKSILTTGARFPIIGTPAFESTKCATSDLARVGMLIHKTALSIAMNKKTEFERARATSAGRLALIVVGSTLYGVKAFRTDHAVTIYVKS